MSNQVVNSKDFRGCCEFKDIVQAVQVTGSFQGTVVYALSKLAGKALVDNFVPRSVLNFPSMLPQGISVLNEKIGRKVLWLGPLAGIMAISLTAYKCYAMAINIVLKGFISGVHTMAMFFFACDSKSKESDRSTSIKDILKDRFITQLKLDDLENDTKHRINYWSDNVASLGVIIVGISLTVFFQNPILADAVTYPLISLVETGTRRFLVDKAIEIKKK